MHRKCALLFTHLNTARYIYISKLWLITLSMAALVVMWSIALVGLWFCSNSTHILEQCLSLEEYIQRFQFEQIAIVLNCFGLVLILFVLFLSVWS